LTYRHIIFVSNADWHYHHYASHSGTTTPAPRTSIHNETPLKTTTTTTTGISKEQQISNHQMEKPKQQEPVYKNPTKLHQNIQNPENQNPIKHNREHEGELEYVIPSPKELTQLTPTTTTTAYGQDTEFITNKPSRQAITTATTTDQTQTTTTTTTSGDHTKKKQSTTSSSSSHYQQRTRQQQGRGGGGGEQILAHISTLINAHTIFAFGNGTLSF
jgi:hypothetical protein